MERKRPSLLLLALAFLSLLISAPAYCGEDLVLARVDEEGSFRP